MVRRLAHHWPLLLALGLLAAWLFGEAVQTYVWQNDEEYSMQLAHWVPRAMPHVLWDTSVFILGTQRLHILIMGAIFAVVDGATALRTIHLLAVLAFVSAAVPVFLLARGMGCGRRWSWVAAILAVVVPWSVLTTSYLSEPYAYPIVLWIVWATWHTCVRPSVGADVLPLAFVALGALTKTNLIAFAVLPPIAVALHALRFGSTPSAGGRAPVRYAARLWHDHRLLTAVGLAGALALLLDATGQVVVLTRIVGAYPTTIEPTFGALVGKWTYELARIVVGSGILPFVVALPWLVRELLAPRDEREHAFAVVALIAVPVLLVSTAVAGHDERYLMYVAPLAIVAMVVTFARRPLALPAYGAGALLVAFWLWDVDWSSPHTPYAYFSFPGQEFWGRVVLLRLGDWVSSVSPELLAALGVLAVLLLAGVLVRLAPRAIVLVIAGLFAVQVVQTRYTITQHVDGVGASSGPNIHARTWLDEKVPHGEEVGAFIYGLGEDPLYVPIWREIEFYNVSAWRTVAFSTPPGAAPVPRQSLFQEAAFDQETGVLTSKLALPSYMAIPRQPQTRALAGTRIARSSYLPVDLMRLTRPVRATFTMPGTDRDGWVPGSGARVRLFSEGLPAGRCLTLTLGAPPGMVGSRAFRLTGLGAPRRGRVAPRSSARVEIALDAVRATGRPFVDLRYTSTGRTRLTDGRDVTLNLSGGDVHGC